MKPRDSIQALFSKPCHFYGGGCRPACCFFFSPWLAASRSGRSSPLVRLSAPRPVAIVAAGYVNGLRSVPLIMVILWFYLLVPLIIGRPGRRFRVGGRRFHDLRGGLLFGDHSRRYSGRRQRPDGRGPLVGSQYARIVSLRNSSASFPANEPDPSEHSASALFQDTSLVYVIGLHDFMTATSITANREGRLLELYLFAAAVYFVACFAASQSVRFIRQRYDIT